MSEGKKEITRRDFLKGSLVVAGGILGGKWVERLANLGKDTPFSEIPGGTKFPLNVDGKGDKDIYLFYANEDVSKLCVRREGTVKFNDGAETVRTLGEITEPVLKKVIGKNSSLPEDTMVGVYPTARGSQINSVGKQGLQEEEGIYALPVITKKIDYMQDGSHVPSEKNMNAPTVPDVRNLKEFGQGLAIGRLDSDSGNFIVLGYVCDARAVELS